MNRIEHESNLVYVIVVTKFLYMCILILCFDSIK